MNPVAYELWGQHAHFEFEPEYEDLCKSLERGAREIERLEAMSELLRAECERLRNQLSVANAYARGSKNI